MPAFTSRKPPERPQPERAEPEPAGHDAFVALAAVTAPPEPTARAKGRALPSSPMPVRFPPEVKRALERLSASDQRSQQQILERVAFPAILAAAARLP